ncbi:hypothetical protein JCM21900_005581 [Sporobolomyces salmonicolor]
MAADAMEYDEKDLIDTQPSKVVADLPEDDIRDEMKKPHRELRRQFQPPTPNELFTTFTGETTRTLDSGLSASAPSTATDATTLTKLRPGQALQGMVMPIDLANFEGGTMGMPGTAMPSSPSGSPRSAKSARLLFRREAQYMLSTPIPSPSRRPASGSVEVVASIERDSPAGMQQSAHLCRAGEEEWVTRIQGETTYFPPLARVQGTAQKRARAAEVEEDAEGAEDAEDAPVAAKASKSSRRSKRRHGADKDSEEEGPVASSSARRAAPAAANKKHPKPRRPDDDHASFDDGASAEAEQSHLGRRAPQSSSSSSSSSPLGRGQRRCTGRTFFAKKEHDDADDLASLCGRVDGLEVRGTVDPESECERTPVPTTAGKRRA